MEYFSINLLILKDNNKKFNMDKSHHFNTSVVVWSLDLKKDPFRLKDNDEMILGPEVPYLIGAQSTRFLQFYTPRKLVYDISSCQL